MTAISPIYRIVNGRKLGSHLVLYHGSNPSNFQVANQSLPEHFLGERTSLVSNKEKVMGSNTDKLKS